MKYSEKILLKFEINMIYNEYKDNESHAIYNIKEFFSPSISLKTAINRIFKKYNIRIGNSQKKHMTNNLPDVFFSDLRFNEYLYDEKYYYGQRLSFIEKYFKISEKILFFSCVDGIGDTLGEYEGIKFSINSNERDIHKNTPHVHCYYSGESFRVDLYKLEIMDGKGFKNNKKTKIALEVIKNNKDALLSKWNAFVLEGKQFKLKMVF